jgi:4-hydroxybenzoate polyprenyltransferase
MALKVVALTASIATFVYLLNDAMDADMDKINSIKSGRPIPSGIATKYQALQLSIIGGIVGISIALTMNVLVLVIALSYITLGFMYSVPPFSLKKRFLMKETTLMIGLFLATGIGALTSGSMQPSLLYLTAYFAIFVMTLMPTFYDALDAEEDKRYGCKTLAILLNQSRRLALSTLGLIVMMVATPFTYSYFGFSLIMPILVCSACFLFLTFIFPMLLKAENVEQRKILVGSKIMQLFLLVLQVSFALGSLINL